MRRYRVDDSLYHPAVDELGFWRTAATRLDRVAVVEASTGLRLEYGTLLELCNRVSNGLSSLGLERGAVVAALMPNEPAFLATYLACLQSGLYFTAINWHHKPSEIAYVLKDSGAKVLVAGSRFESSAKEAAKIAGMPPGALILDVEAFANSHHGSAPETRSAGAAMLYTSGTTGKPKGVRRPLLSSSPEEGISLVTFLPRLFGIEPENGVHLTTGPLYHNAPLAFTACALHFGHTVVLMSKWSPEATLELIERERVIWTHMVPTMMHRVMRLPEEMRKRADISSLTHLVHAAAPVPLDLKISVIEWLGPVVYEYYSATEGGGTYVTPQQWLERPGTVGRPWPNSDVKILDDDGGDLPPGSPGLVYMKLSARGDFEYHGDPEKTEQAKRGEYFTVGDIGYLDKDGWLFLCDRATDMIISGGVNIYPAEVENVLLGHPKVRDVAVVGVPDEEWGENVKAVVEPSEGAEATSDLEKELIHYAKERLAHYKCPKSVDFLDALPRSPTGKLARRTIRDMYGRKQMGNRPDNSRT